MVLDSSSISSQTGVSIGPGTDKPVLTSELIQLAEERFGASAIKAAVDEFHDQFGKCFYSDSFFASHLAYFHHFFLFTDNFNEAANLEHIPAKILAPDYGEYPRHGLFLVKETQKKLKPTRDFKDKVTPLTTLKCQELISGQIFFLYSQPNSETDSDPLQDLNDSSEDQSRWLEAGQVFQCFYKAQNQDCWSINKSVLASICQGLIIHPKSTTKIIKKALQQAKKEAPPATRFFASKLAKALVRYLRHQHVSAEGIYGSELLKDSKKWSAFRRQ